MKKLIIIAVVLISSTQLFAQNNVDNKYSYNKEGLSQQDINTREAYIKSVKAEELKASQVTKVQVETSTNEKLVPIQDAAEIGTQMPVSKSDKYIIDKSQGSVPPRK